MSTSLARAFLGRPAPGSAPHFLAPTSRARCGAARHSRFSALAENLEPEALPDGTSCLVFFEVLRGAANLTGPESSVLGATSGGGGARLSPPEGVAPFRGPQRA